MTELNRLLDETWDFADPASSAARFESLVGRLSDPVASAIAQTQHARAIGLAGDFESADILLQQVERDHPQPGDELAVRILLERGRVHNSMKRTTEALPLFLAAYQTAHESNLDPLAVDAAHMVAIAESGDARRKWNQIAIDLAESSTSERARKWRGSLLNNMGWDVFGAGDHQGALALFQRALDARLESEDQDRVHEARWCVGRTLRALGRLDEALAIQQSLVSGRPTDGYVQEELGECLVALDRHEQSVPHFALAHEVLSAIPWLAETQPARIARLAQLAQA